MRVQLRLVSSPRRMSTRCQLLAISVECHERSTVRRHRVVIEVAAHDIPKPLPLNRDRLVHAPSPNRRPSTSWASPSSAANPTPANSRSNELPEHQVRTLGSDAVIEAGEQMTQSTSPTAA